MCERAHVCAIILLWHDNECTKFIIDFLVGMSSRLDPKTKPRSKNTLIKAQCIIIKQMEPIDINNENCQILSANQINTHSFAHY